jgi:hypothetical protein
MHSARFRSQRLLHARISAQWLLALAFSLGLALQPGLAPGPGPDLALALTGPWPGPYLLMTWATDLFSILTW